MLTLQDVLQRLTAFWSERGAILVQPMNTEVGAGTANPATTLRVLGPEPWRVGYVEPSVRPDDSRYGKNPNRLQTHTQFQVILKPDPGDPQELYLASLQAIGVDLEAHDIRFVEDNWSSPALGAWGLGWEVWLDGLEITQFTYFQQSGSLTLDPVSVEITYGIERIMMALQDVNHFADIVYAPGMNYGEAWGQAEFEMSSYYLDAADVDRTRALYDIYVGEAEALLDEGLPVPAHYCVLKSSHAFNVLDARGAISTAERARAFTLMRRLSKRVAELWVERRQEQGFPLGTVPVLERRPPLPLRDVSRAETLLFEIGVEELPVDEVTRAQEWLRETLLERLAGTRLSHGEVRTYATPRRLVAIIAEVEPYEAAAVETVRGPRVIAAFDVDGNPTPAAAGFARRHGVDPTELERLDIDGTEYVAVVSHRDGLGAPEVLSKLLAKLVLDLRSTRNMRWRDPVLTYARPIRWLLALLGTTPVPVTASALTSGTTTRVHRNARKPVVEVASADGYIDLLRGHDVVADPKARRQIIVEAAQRAAEGKGGRIDFDADGGVIDEIVNLVESPTPVLASFEERYLALPAEILVGVMRKHQRYVPVRGEQGLLPHFLTFANGPADTTLVARGNEAVVRARFEDALYFWNADLMVAPSVMQESLSRLTFEETLGSMAERVVRIGAVARDLAGHLTLTDEERVVLDRAARLVKFDLGSQMVTEMTSLAGTMARYYAEHAGEPTAVAEALEDMEHPRTSDDSAARSAVGAILAVADRADLLVSLFWVGANPTGSSDPFALRRAALGLLSTLREVPDLASVRVSTVLVIAARALRDQGHAVPDTLLEDVAAFVRGRLEQQMLDGGRSPDAVSAALPLADEPRRAGAVVAELEDRANDPELASVVEAIQRVRRLVKDAPPVIDRDALTTRPELRLLAVVESLGRTQVEAGVLGELSQTFAELVDAINEFLDRVLVNDDDPRVRSARVGLLAEVARIAGQAGVDWAAVARFLGARH